MVVSKKSKKELSLEKKPRKENNLKEGKISGKELERELSEIEEKFEGAGDEIKRDIQVKASKPIYKVKKGDKIKVDGVEYEVDAHYTLMEHPSNKEMAIEVFNSKTNVDYQIRYFDDQVESTIDFYELQGEIMFMRKPCKKIEW